MYSSSKELLRAATDRRVPIWQLALEQTLVEQNQTEADFKSELLAIYNIMKTSAQAALNKEVKSISGLLNGNARSLFARRNQGIFFSPEVIGMMAMAISTSEFNAAMGRIVASPTAGAAGILPAALLAYQQMHALPDEEMIKGLLTASQIGAIVMARANVAGAEGGCQAETGSAASMAAAALVELAGGTPEQALNAAGFAIINVLGLVCDPIGGRVEYPCFMRNANGVLNAVGAAEMALADIQVFADYDQVLAAMKEVGDALPESLRETGMGGMAKHCHVRFRTVSSDH